MLRADQIRTLPAGHALVLWSRLPPFVARMPLLSERRPTGRRYGPKRPWPGGAMTGAPPAPGVGALYQPCSRPGQRPAQ